MFYLYEFSHLPNINLNKCKTNEYSIHLLCNKNYNKLVNVYWGYIFNLNSCIKYNIFFTTSILNVNGSCHL